MKTNRIFSREGFEPSIKSFLGSRWYPPFVMLLFFLSHVFAWEVPMVLLLAVPTILGFLFAEDLRFLVPVLTGCIGMISVKHTPYLPTESDYYVTGARIPLVIIGGSILAIAAAYFLWRMRTRAAALSQLRLRYGFIAFFAAMLLAGLFQENALKNVVYGLGVGASFFAIYLLFGLFHPKTKDNAEHFLYTVLCAGLLVTAELFLLYFQSVLSGEGFPQKSDILLGWGTWTQIGAMIALCLPAPFYFAREAGRSYPLYLFAGALMTVALLLSGSRASWLYGGVVLLFALTLLCLGGRNRKKSRIVLVAVFLACLVGLLVLLPKILAFLSAFVQFGVGDNGRFAIWGSALRSFLAAPVFGRGFFNTDIVLEGFPPIMPYLYHNTPLQMLGSAGIVGLLLYLFHRFETVRHAFYKRKSALSLFLLLIPFALVIFSLTDEHMFHIYPAFFYAAALSLSEGEFDEPPLIQK